MMGDDKTVYFAVEQYGGHPDTLADKLHPFGVRLPAKRGGFWGCVSYATGDGDVCTEVGHLTHWLEGPNQGLTLVWPRSDADDHARIVMLRAAEEAQRDGYVFTGWTEGKSPIKSYRMLETTICLIDRGSGLSAYEHAVSRTPLAQWAVAEQLKELNESLYLID